MGETFQYLYTKLKWQKMTIHICIQQQLITNVYLPDVLQRNQWKTVSEILRYILLGCLLTCKHTNDTDLLRNK